MRRVPFQVTPFAGSVRLATGGRLRVWNGLGGRDGERIDGMRGGRCCRGGELVSNARVIRARVSGRLSIRDAHAHATAADALHKRSGMDCARCASGALTSSASCTFARTFA